MDELKKVFEARDTAFEKKTIEIFELIHTTLVCVTEFLNDVDPIFAAGSITWEDANLMDDMVIIVGMVDYMPGTTIEMDGNLITITEENIDYFQRVVHMSLPFELVEAGNENELMEFLQRIHEEQTASQLSTSLDESKKPELETDFDLSKLTDEQRQALMLYNMKGKS